MRVFITGASGFIGSNVAGACRRAGHETTSLTRKPLRASPSAAVGDLLSAKLGAMLSGADVVVHAASSTNGTSAQLWAGNVEGTRRIVDAARRRDVPLIYVSTTGVYGKSSGTFGHPWTMTRNPTSELSRARAAAEDLVLAAGGSVLRPHVVHGPGDRWIVPPLAQLTTALNGWIGGPNVRVAAISVSRLGTAIAALLGKPLPPVLHVAEAEPVSIAALVRSHLQGDPALSITRTIPVDQAWQVVRHHGISRNALEMVSRDSAMDAAPLWDLAESHP